MKKTTLNDVLNVIKKWQKDNEVIFFGSFMEFDKTDKCEVKNDRIICYGDKETLKIGLDEFNKMFKEDKNKFTNW